MNDPLHIQGQEAQSYQTIASPAMPQHTSIHKTSVHQTSVPLSIHHTAPQIKPQTTVHQTTASLIERTMPSVSSQARTQQIRSQAILPPVPPSIQQMTPPVTSHTATRKISPQATVHKTMVPPLIHHTITQIGSQTASPQISPQATVQQTRPKATVHQTLPPFVHETLTQSSSQETVPQFIQQTSPSSRSLTATSQIGPQATIPPTKLHYLKSGILNIHNIFNNMARIVKTFIDNPSEFNFDISTPKLEEFVKQLDEQSERFDTEKNKIFDTTEKGLLTLLGQQVTNLVNGTKDIIILLRLFARETSQKEKLRTREDIQFLYTKMLTENELIKQRQTNFIRQSNEQTRQKQNRSSSSILGTK
uniref:Uncharacterized protein n=1 Tax=Meloidogyne enterolobii TaxID=390850 RepID=A0A6V7UK13_MELEN|nr:unnamed protein product [Meloidogyne enterolobii]